MSPAFADYMARIAILAPAFLVGISFHEFSHAFVAYLLGDDTAKRMGRLTLNPMSHFDFIGFLCLLVFGIGWAKPVSVNKSNFKYSKTYDALTSLAGPFSNFLIAIVFLYVIKYFPLHLFSSAVALSCSQMFEALASINIMLGIFNLLPIPPLDGSHLITNLLEDRFPNFVFWIYKYSFIILLIFIYILPTMYFLNKLTYLAWFWLSKLVF